MLLLLLLLLLLFAFAPFVVFVPEPKSSPSLKNIFFDACLPLGLVLVLCEASDNTPTALDLSRSRSHARVGIQIVPLLFFTHNNRIQSTTTWLRVCRGVLTPRVQTRTFRARPGKNTPLHTHRDRERPERTRSELREQQRAAKDACHAR